MQQPALSVLESLKFRPRLLLSVGKYITNITEMILLNPSKVKALGIICLDLRKKPFDTLPHNRSIYKARQHITYRVNNVLKNRHKGQLKENMQNKI